MPDNSNNTLKRRTVLGSLGAVAAASAVGVNVEAASTEQSASGDLTKRFEGHIAPDAPDWVYVPFEVPDGVTEIHVKYDYNKSTENLLDIGAFDPDGHELGNDAGFRGWSGGARTEFFISAAEATPGYYAGPIEPGTWEIILGPYRIGGGGIDYTIDIEMRTDNVGDPFEPVPAPTEPRNDTAGWYRGDLHLHTVHSDGEWTPEELVAGVADVGLDFFVSTDHNTTTANRIWGKYARPDLLIVNGEEVTTRAGHYNAAGLDYDQWIDWRYKPSEDEQVIDRFVAQVHDGGGMVTASHPFCPYKGCDFRFDYELMDAIEVWNGPWTWDDEAAVHLWDRFLREGTYLPAVGASDSHGPDNEIGLPQTVVYADRLGRDAVLSGLTRGNAYIARSDNVSVDFTATAESEEVIMGERLPSVPEEMVTLTLRVRGAAGAEATFHTQDSIVHIEEIPSGCADVSYETNALAADFVRVEIRNDEDSMLALTNPIFLGEET